MITFSFHYFAVLLVSLYLLLESYSREVLSQRKVTLSLNLSVDHWVYDWSQITLQIQKSLEESSCSLQTTTLLWRICLEIVPVRGMKAYKSFIMRIFCYSKEFSKLYCIVLAQFCEFSTPFKDENSFCWDFLCWVVWINCNFNCFHLNFPIKSFKMPSNLKNWLELDKLHQYIINFVFHLT